MTAINENLKTNVIDAKHIDPAHIYNLEIDKEKNQFSLQFKQLRSYYNFRRIFKESLKQGKCLFPNENNDNSPFQNENSFVQKIFCFIDKKWLQQKIMLDMIDKKWLQQWKNHVGYDLIHKELKNRKINRELNDNDYEWFKPIIEHSSKENYIFPLNNKNIYKNNSNIIDPRAEFEIINEKCYKNFVIGNIEEKTHELQKKIHKPVKFFKEKLLIMLDTLNLMTFQLNIKVHSLNKTFEILIEFKENNDGKKKILDYFEEKDIDQLIKELKIDLMKDVEKKFNLFNCKFKLFNKTLFSYMSNTSLTNFVRCSFIGSNE